MVMNLKEIENGWNTFQPIGEDDHGGVLDGGEHLAGGALLLEAVALALHLVRLFAVERCALVRRLHHLGGRRRQHLCVHDRRHHVHVSSSSFTSHSHSRPSQVARGQITSMIATF